MAEKRKGSGNWNFSKLYSGIRGTSVGTTRSTLVEGSSKDLKEMTEKRVLGRWARGPGFVSTVTPATSPVAPTSVLSMGNPQATYFIPAVTTKQLKTQIPTPLTPDIRRGISMNLVASPIDLGPHSAELDALLSAKRAFSVDSGNPQLGDFTYPSPVSVQEKFKDRCIPHSPASRPSRPSQPSPVSSSEDETEERIRYILYLEPCPSSMLCIKIEEFWDESIEKFGKNEAHMYRPHVSATGFFDLPTTIESHCENHFSDQSETLVVQHVMQEFSQLPSKSSRPSPTVIGLRRPDPQTLLVSVQTPKMYLDILNSLASLPFNIRPKKCDHISLAYANKYVKIPPSDFNAEIVDGLERLAKDVLGGDERMNELAEWDLVLYRVGVSSNLSKAHEFTQLKRWRIS